MHNTLGHQGGAGVSEREGDTVNMKQDEVPLYWGYKTRNMREKIQKSSQIQNLKLVGKLNSLSSKYTVEDVGRIVLLTFEISL